MIALFSKFLLNLDLIEPVEVEDDTTKPVGWDDDQITTTNIGLDDQKCHLVTNSEISLLFLRK